MVDNKYLIAITGTVGSGKTTVANILREYGYYVFDTDAFSKEILKKDRNIRDKLSHLLGVTLEKDIAERFKEIGRLFDNNQNLEQAFEAWYQEYLGNAILEKKIINNNEPGFVFYDIPLLKQKKICSIFDFFWIIDSNEKICFNRIKQRNNYKENKIRYLMEYSRVEKTSYDKCYIIENNSSIICLKKNVHDKLQLLTDICF